MRPMQTEKPFNPHPAAVTFGCLAGLISLVIYLLVIAAMVLGVIWLYGEVIA